ncbi:uncharacterized protein LOC110462075 [Mizuhopecten yessoensis]|uniref:uncharacterized protein LOC110462075 n=1 Tax=Mizuhopecten yessoensis TaxID=6573 RepID=UPI000B45DEF9|nr:uncharacterized protein LOC110462075 [Mizuhopecten yessoensis]XP_021371554.1 uncharacterized protein LOC110462075 [Mizuhopecten yessoensis]XP_021371557.1 uncharacterized protein LOC110462075 [Mizuhopecten yessoensis]XP_021371558.1 uncharacterized protein LOC110462075 [Mizuhopecten yessoensis]XP_021371559.1 uncharacterized protein LOC110462075 [Mizuhopecten yessoensis]XP_021371560.1 uncharacterized protein LOC110462075 [Mizuhopecten yessoensis]
MAMAFSPRLLKHQVGVHVEVKRILDFMTETKDVSFDTIVKSLHKATDIQQKIKDKLKDFDIDVIIIDDANDVNSTLEYLQEKQKSDEDVLAYVRLYMNDETKNTVWLKCDFPCPVVFDFCKTKAVSVIDHSAIEKACNEEFSLGSAAVRKQIAKLKDYFDDYASNLWKVISTYDDEEQIYKFIKDAFDEYTNEHKLQHFACDVWLCGYPNTPYRLRNVFEVKANKSKLVNAILKEVCQNINNSIRRKIWNKILKQLDMTAFEAVEWDVSRNPVGDVTFAGIFIWIFDVVWTDIRLIISAVVTLFKPQDINSATWRKDIATATYQSLQRRKNDIVNEINKPYQAKCKHSIGKIEQEIRETQKIPNSAKNNPGCKLTAASYGTDEFGNKVVALRAENFDHIHLSYDKGMDFVLDQKTIKESTTEMQLVDTYIDRNLLEYRRISFNRNLNQIVRKHTPELMKKHSNLITISTSPVMSRRDGIKNTECIVIYCSCKGIIPLEEPEFPQKLDGIPVDVREGYIYFATAREFHDPLRLGCSIGVSGESKAGSIGVFVKEIDTAEQYGLLTCGHVLLASQELDRPTYSIRQNIRSASIDVVQPSYMDDPNNRTCGKLIDARFGNVIYKGSFTGVDYAYVKMTSRIPRVLKFPSVEREHEVASRRDGYIEEMKMGLPILDMDENDTKHDVCKFGRTSGFTKGVFDFSGAAIRKDTLSAPLCQGEEDRHLYNLYNIKSLGRPFCDLGDSGASVFIQKESGARVIGLAVGGLINGRECFVTPIGAVLDSIEPRIEIQCFPN